MGCMDIALLLIVVVLAAAAAFGGYLLATRRADAELAARMAQGSGIDWSLGVTLERPATFTPDTTDNFAALQKRLRDGAMGQEKGLADGERLVLWADAAVDRSALAEVQRLYAIDALELEPPESLARRIAEVHGGTVTAQPAANGATFTLALPLR